MKEYAPLHDISSRCGDHVAYNVKSPTFYYVAKYFWYMGVAEMAQNGCDRDRSRA